MPVRREFEYAHAQIREVRKRAVARGLLLGSETPIKPSPSPQQAMEAYTTAIQEERVRAVAEADLPPRALWERQRAKAAAAAAAAEVASPRSTASPRPRSASAASASGASTSQPRSSGAPGGARRAGGEIRTIM